MTDIENPNIQNEIVISDFVNGIVGRGVSTEEIYHYSRKGRYFRLSQILSGKINNISSSNPDLLELVSKDLSNRSSLSITDYCSGEATALLWLYKDLSNTPKSLRFNIFDKTDPYLLGQDIIDYFSEEVDPDTDDFEFNYGTVDITSNYKYPKADVGIIGYLHYYLPPNEFKLAIARQLDN